MPRKISGLFLILVAVAVAVYTVDGTAHLRDRRLPRAVDHTWTRS